MFTRKRVIISVSILLAGALAAVLTVWLLAVSGNICVARVAVAPEERLHESAYLREEVESMKKSAEEAIMRAFDADRGFFLYEANPDGTVFVRDNDIRQFLASRVLALMAHDSEEALMLHKKNLSTIMTEWYLVEGEYGYAYAYEKSKLGGNALLIRALVVSPLFPEYEAEAERLAESILAAQAADGSFHPWLKEPDYAYDAHYLLTFYSGEAILALLELSDKTGEERWRNVAEKAQDFYLGEYVERLEENYYPAYVPWHTLSLYNLYTKTNDERYKDAIFRLTDELLLMQDRERFVGRFYNERTPEYGTPHVSSDAVYTEGLAVAYRLAKEAGEREREARYKEALILAFHNLRSLQFTASPFRVFDEDTMAERLSGGMQKHACSLDVRIDSTAHTVDALSALEEAL